MVCWVVLSNQKLRLTMRWYQLWAQRVDPLGHQGQCDAVMGCYVHNPWKRSPTALFDKPNSALHAAGGTRMWSCCPGRCFSHVILLPVWNIAEPQRLSIPGAARLGSPVCEVATPRPHSQLRACNVCKPLGWPPATFQWWILAADTDFAAPSQPPTAWGCISAAPAPNFQWNCFFISVEVRILRLWGYFPHMVCSACSLWGGAWLLLGPTKTPQWQILW